MKRLFVLLLLPALILAGCSQKKEKLATSIFPLTWLVENIYPSYGIYQIVKPGQNPHLYDLTPRDAIEIEESRKVFLIGNLEPFGRKIPPEKRVEVIKILGLSPSANPHIWLSPRKWLEVAQKLPKATPSLKLSREGWENTLKRLQKLDKDYKTIKKKHIKAVLILPAFYWLCKDYGIKVLYILQPNPESGISVKRFTELVAVLKKNPNALVIYSTANPKAVEIISKLKRIAPSLKSVGLDPLIWQTEGDYVKLMEENLNRLKRALKGN